MCEPTGSWHWRALELHHPLGLGHDMEDLSSTSSSLSSRSPCTPRTGCGEHSPAAGICSALSPSAGFAPEQSWVCEPTGSCCWRALELRDPWERGHELEDQFSSSSLAGSCWLLQRSRWPLERPPCPPPRPAKTAVKRSCPFLLKGPEQWGNPRSSLRGQRRAS